MEYIGNINSAEHLEPKWGERFRSWYVTEVFNRKEKFIGSDDWTYDLNVFDYQYRFIMPSRIEFSKGINEDGKIVYGVINYTESERLLGVFRFPQESGGFFAAPLNITKTIEIVKNFSSDQLKELINKKKVLTFEAFRIPFFGFQFFKIMDSDFEEIEKLRGVNFANYLRDSYIRDRDDRLNEIKLKITALPNNLLILQNVLDLRWTDEKEISMMTEGIIHFGI
jgi:hypothetical protein